jgi:SSS family solute:Na+ symporter
MLISMSLLDIFIILIYFGIILWIAQWASKNKSESKGAVDYFLAGKNSGWMVIGASLFASNIGSEIIL